MGKPILHNYTDSTKDIHNELIETLVDITMYDYNHKSVVFTTSDAIAKLVDAHKTILEKTCVVPKINSDTLSLGQFLDKSYANMIAKESGLLVPDSVIVDLTEYNPQVIYNIEFPCIVKPVRSFEGQKNDIKVFNNQDKLVSYFTYLKNKNYRSVLVQQYIDGPESRMVGLVGFVANDGEVYITGIMDKKREYPLNTGSTSYGAFSYNKFNLDIEKVIAFIKRTRYIGIFDFDFKYSDGKCYFIEMNFRNGALSYASTAAGINIVYLWYLDACGIDISKRVNKVENGLKFMLEIRDFRHVLDRNISLLTWLKDLYQTDIFLVLDKSDIMPFMAKILMRVKAT